MFACLFKGHVWEHFRDVHMYESNYSTRPCYMKRVYQCKRCLKVKSVKV